jgi:hypothetical protein
MTRIRIELNKTIRQMRTGQFPNTEMFYFRGLEKQLPKLKREREERVGLAIFAIQEYPFDHKISKRLDEDWIDKIYRKITAKGVEMINLGWY